MEERYFDYIKGLNFYNLKTEIYRLSNFKKSKTLKLISRLRRSYGENPSDKESLPFDVLVIDDVIANVVIMYSIPEDYKRMANGGYITLTDIKKSPSYSGVLYASHSLKCEVDFNSSYTLQIWEEPQILHAVTDSDNNYGDRYYWCGGECEVEEGNKYGDTSTFLIIGNLKRKS